jgi:hypothetical protein
MYRLVRCGDRRGWVEEEGGGWRRGRGLFVWEEELVCGCCSLLVNVTM